VPGTGEFSAADILQLVAVGAVTAPRLTETCQPQTARYRAERGDRSDAAIPPKKSPLRISLPNGWEPVRFERNRKGLKEALEFLAGAVLDGEPEVVGMNVGLLDTIAERMPELAEEVANLRAAAAEAMAPPDPEPEPDEVCDQVSPAAASQMPREASLGAQRDEFGLPPIRPPADEGVPPTET
jgi:hypothetical protein